MKPHERLGLAIARAGYTWTPEMRQAWEDLDRQTTYMTNVLEACAAIVAWCDKNPPSGDALYCIKQARAALAKVTVEIEE